MSGPTAPVKLKTTLPGGPGGPRGPGIPLRPTLPEIPCERNIRIHVLHWKTKKLPKDRIEKMSLRQAIQQKIRSNK